MSSISASASGQLARRVPRWPRRAVPLGRAGAGEEGFALIAVVVAIFLILLAMSVAAPQVARSLRREREVETMRRANQYVRALQLYYKKFGHYPGSMEQLEKSNNIRFLRERYVDPMTGKDDWRLIHVGEQKTTVKSFFGKPLAGIAGSGLGSAAGNASAGGPGTPIGAGAAGGGLGGGASLGGGAGGASQSSAFTLGGGSSSDSTAATGGDASAAGGVGASGNSLSSGPGSGLGSGPGSTTGSFGSTNGGLGSASGSGPSGGAPFLGIGVPRDGTSILTVNEQTTYPAWEFLYDPRIEQLRSRVNLLGGGIASTGAGSLGSASGNSSNFGGPANSGTQTPGSTSGSGSAQPASPPQQQ